MSRKNTGALAIGALLIFLLMKGRPAAGNGDSSGVKIEILDEEGNPVPQNSPAEVEEGKSYTVRATIKNQTTRGGKAYEATLETVIEASANEGVVPLITWDARVDLFAAGQTIVYSSPLMIPDGLGGTEGVIVVNVWGPDMGHVGSAVETLTIKSMEIIYAASVSLGV